MTEAEFNKYYRENRTGFRDEGEAAIPGTQISYPAFYKDSLGDIYVTYRFAMQPTNSFAAREFSTGVAKYELGSQTWKSIGPG